MLSSNSSSAQRSVVDKRRLSAVGAGRGGRKGRRGRVPYAYENFGRIVFGFNGKRVHVFMFRHVSEIIQETFGSVPLATQLVFTYVCIYMFIYCVVVGGHENTL